MSVRNGNVIEMKDCLTLKSATVLLSITFSLGK